MDTLNITVVETSELMRAQPEWRWPKTEEHKQVNQKNSGDASGAVIALAAPCGDFDIQKWLSRLLRNRISDVWGIISSASRQMNKVDGI